jgi:hypothetical protein
MKTPVNALTFRYGPQFELDHVAENLVERLGESDQNIVLCANSYGGAVLHRMLENIPIEDPLRKRIRGVIFQATPLSKEHYTPKALRQLKLVSTRLGRRTVRTVDSATEASGMDEAVPDPDITERQLQQIPETHVQSTLEDIPTRCIVFGGDRLVDNSSLISTLAQETGTPQRDLVIRLPSGKGKKGHEPTSWEPVFEKEAEMIDGFFS